jgi:hypothetical protein
VTPRAGRPQVQEPLTQEWAIPVGAAALRNVCVMGAQTTGRRGSGRGGVDLRRSRSGVVWCRRFTDAFGTAPLR